MPVPNEARPCRPDRHSVAQQRCEAAVPAIDLSLHRRSDYPAVVTIRIETIRDREVPDGDMQLLLTQAYVDGGFTAPDRAREIFAPAAIHARGDILCAWFAGSAELAGMVIVVPPTSAAKRFAGDDEAEMHLLATASAFRRMGVGRALVHAAMDHARKAGLSRMLLWTQTSMHAAQRLYASAGFVRVPGRDFSDSGQRFLFFTADL
jgi:ribosomal protein S18 acetylase RimI-like enzyme